MNTLAVGRKAWLCSRRKVETNTGCSTKATNAGFTGNLAIPRTSPWIIRPDPLDERKGDVYVLAYSPTNPDLGEVFVIKPNAAGNLPEETTAEEQSKAAAAAPRRFQPRKSTANPAGAAGIAVDPATWRGVCLQIQYPHVVNVFNDKGEEQPALNIGGSETPGSFSTDRHRDRQRQRNGLCRQPAVGTCRRPVSPEKRGSLLGQITQTPSGEVFREPEGDSGAGSGRPDQGRRLPLQQPERRRLRPARCCWRTSCWPRPRTSAKPRRR